MKKDWVWNHLTNQLFWVQMTKLIQYFDLKFLTSECIQLSLMHLFDHYVIASYGSEVKSTKTAFEMSWHQKSSMTALVASKLCQSPIEGYELHRPGTETDKLFWLLSVQIWQCRFMKHFHIRTKRFTYKYKVRLTCKHTNSQKQGL